MTKDCYGTCPKCGEIGWCHYKGKARIFKSGPGSDLYKVSLFKCGNCGKKFGFELEDSTPEPKVKDDPYEKTDDYLYDMLEKLQNDYEEEDDSEDWKKVYDLLDIVNSPCIPKSYLVSALEIAAKHCGCDS